MTLADNRILLLTHTGVGTGPRGLSTFSEAAYSPDMKYRYLLYRSWSDEIPRKRVCFVMLNPSTATESENDPTIRKCVKYADRWGYGGLSIVNLFALRSTDPARLYTHADPVGERNLHMIETSAAWDKEVILAWGAHGSLKAKHRVDSFGVQVADMLRPYSPKCLAVTSKGHPGHPLYLKDSLDPIPFPYTGDYQ